MNYAKHGKRAVSFKKDQRAVLYFAMSDIVHISYLKGLQYRNLENSASDDCCLAILYL